MPLGADQYRDWICKELKGGALIEGNIGLLWEAQSRFAAAPEVQYLRTKIAAINFLLGNLDEQIAAPVQGDLRNRAEQRRLVLLDLRREAQAALLAMGGVGATSYGPVVSKLTTTSIIPSEGPSPLPVWPDANDSRYSGDPNVRSMPGVPP